VTDQLTLDIPVCVLPGCDNPAPAWGQPCASCLDDFGDYLQPADGTPMDREAIQARDQAIREQLRAQRTPHLDTTAPSVQPVDEPELKRNQTCWLCEERRTCTRTRTAHAWECATCQAVT
jgi:hypothetical protein